MNAEWPAIPCGLVAKSMFNDTFKIFKGTKDNQCLSTDTSCTSNEIEIKQKNIAWTSDVMYKFANIKTDTIPADVVSAGGTDYNHIQWQDMKEEHFIVWMRTAGLPNFRKLYGQIDERLEKGKYSIRISNQYNVKPFSGGKSFVLSTTNALGGKNYFLAVCYIVVGALCFLFAFIFCIANLKKNR